MKQTLPIVLVTCISLACFKTSAVGPPKSKEFEIQSIEKKFAACLKMPGHEDNASRGECYGDREEQIDLQLKSVYSKITNALATSNTGDKEADQIVNREKSTILAAFVASQNLWLKFRTVNAELAGKKYVGGRAEGFATSDASFAMTKFRIQELSEFFRDSDYVHL